MAVWSPVGWPETIRHADSTTGLANMSLSSWMFRDEKHSVTRPRNPPSSREKSSICSPRRPAEVGRSGLRHCRSRSSSSGS